MPVRESGFARTNPLSPWLPICSGFVAAEITASVLCVLPDAFHHWLPKLVARSLLYAAATVTAGLAGTFFPAWLTDRRSLIPTPLLARLSFAGWVFLPAIVLLYRQHSPLVLLAVAAACIPLATGLERLSALEDRIPGPAPFCPDFFSSLYGLPRPEYNPSIKFVLAALLAGAGILAANTFWALASLCFAAFVFLATWRWNVLIAHMRRRRASGRTARIRMTASATLLALFAMLFWSMQSGRVAQGTVAHKTPVPAPGAGAGAAHGADYVGVILLPPKSENKEIVAPAPSSPLAIGQISKPVTIPFDGPYWFFKAPARQPGKNAHVAHGKATDVNVHSSNLDPLLMEAHQTLGSVVDLRCCSALELKVLNADNRPGTIGLDVLLSDRREAGKPSLYLGELILPSSQPADIPKERAPVEETLRFSIPREARFLRFDELTVVFHMAPYHARYGAKVAIESFTLLPR